MWNKSIHFCQDEFTFHGNLSIIRQNFWIINFRLIEIHVVVVVTN